MSTLECCLETYNSLNPKIIVAADEVIVVLPKATLPSREQEFFYMHFTLQGNFKYLL